MKRIIFPFLLFAFCFLVGCNLGVKDDAANQSVSANNPAKVEFSVNESKTDITERTENDNITHTDFNDQSSFISIETQSKECPFSNVDFVEVKALYRENKDVSGEFKEIKTITDTSELQNFKNSLSQENWTYHSSSQGWAKFRPSEPNNRVVIIETKQKENYVIHLYSDYDSNSFFLSMADYDATMDYDEFAGLSDSEKDFKRYSVSRNIYTALLELYN